MENYYPKKGEIIWCDLDPVKGHEQAGLRPCVVVSANLFNKKTGRAIICPMTSTVREDFRFRVVVTGKVKGHIMIDQVRAIDWTKRATRSGGMLPEPVLQEVNAKFVALLGGE